MDLSDQLRAPAAVPSVEEMCLISPPFLDPSLSPAPDTFGWHQEQPTKHEHFRKGSAAILTSSPYKNKFQENRGRKGTRNQRQSSSKIRSQKKRQSGRSDANVSIIRGEHGMKRVIILRLRKL